MSNHREKPEDCIKTKQYWSTSFIIEGEGTCAPCPLHWKNCKDEGTIADQNRCVDSCRVRPKPKPKKSSTSTKFPLTRTTSYITPKRSKVVSTSSMAVVDKPSRQPRHDDQHQLLFVVVSALSLAVVIALLLLMMMLVRRMRKKSAGNRRAEANRKDVDEPVAYQAIQQNDAVELAVELAVERLQPNDAVECLQPPNDVEEPVAPPQELVRPPVQAAPSSTRTGGIQEEPKEKGSSLLHLPEIHS